MIVPTMLKLRPIRLLLIVTLMAASLVWQAAPVSRAQASFDLLVSSSSARTNPQPLAGQTLAGNVYVFTTPDAPEIEQVRFYLDNPDTNGSPRQTENSPPYDFAGGSVGAASAFNTESVADGPHTITAELELNDGSITVIHANFIVQNDEPADGIPPAPPSDLTATSSETGADLDWANNSEADLRGYHVYRASDPDGPFVKLTSSPILTSAYSDAAAPGGTSYYRVTAVDSSGNESTPSNVAQADRPAVAFNILVSTSSSRANPQPLDGQVVAGGIYVFTAPDTSAIEQVRFYLDDPAMNGSPRQTENNPPYDFAGGTVGAASAFDTGSESDGPHTITAELELNDGSITVIHANFTVANDGPSTGAGLVFDQHALSFSSPVDGSTLSQTVTLSATDSSTPIASFSDNVSWATLSPSSDQTPALLTITVDPSDLVAGTYTATVKATAPGYGTASLPISLSLPGPGPDQVHLAWTDDPATSLTVIWRTLDTTVPSVVEYRVKDTSVWMSASGSVRPSGTTGILHEVLLESLTPATTYEYRVQGPNTSWSDVFETRTAPGPGPADFDLIYVADTGLIGRQDGLATGTRQVIDEIRALNPLVVLPGGDYAYYDTDKRFGTLGNSIDAWFNQMQPVASRSPLMPTYGNHEAHLQENSSTWAERFPTPDGFDEHRNYSFDIGDVHFVSIYVVHNDDPLSDETIDWIRQDIQAAKVAGQRWIIPYFHVSPFSEGTNHPSNLAIRSQLGPLFESLGVQIVIASHDQSYERTYPLLDVPATNTPTSLSKTCYTLSDGVTWIKVSPGGKLSNISRDFSPWDTATPPHWTAFRDNSMHHFLRVRVSASGSLRVEAFGVTGDGSPPVIQDAFEYTTQQCPEPDRTPPAAPTELTAAGEEAGTVLVWANNTETDLAGYHVYRASTESGPFLKITSGLIGTTSFTDTAAPGGTSYYRVTAVDTSGNESDPSNLAEADRPVGAYTLLVSTSSNRANPQPLDGQVVEDNIYVFTSPDTPDIERVRFYLDNPAMNGGPRRTENNAPYDFAGGSVNTATAFNTAQLADGAHTITAALELSDDSTAVIHASFTVTNNAAAKTTHRKLGDAT